MTHPIAFLTRFGFVAASLLAIGGAACSSTPENTAQSQGAIEEGELDTGDPAVGKLTGGRIPCTAVLIDPSWVLSVSKCINGDEQNLSFQTGSGPSDLVDHPIVPMTNYAVEPDSQVLLLRLATPIYTTNPMHIGRTLPVPGLTCRVVGFGEYNSPTGRASYGYKRDGWSQIVSNHTVNGPIITVTGASALADWGDFGGPLICDGDFLDAVDWGPVSDDPGAPNHTQEWYVPIPFDWLQLQTGGVLFGCTPRTCADAHATCGTISDFCGSTLSCGGCDASSTCTATNVCCPTSSYDPTTGACGGDLNCPKGYTDCGGVCCRCHGTRCQ